MWCALSVIVCVPAATFSSLLPEVVGGSATLGSCSLGEAKQAAREGGKEREDPDIPMFVRFLASNDGIDMIF
jgi:hypothetical protein